MPSPSDWELIGYDADLGLKKYIADHPDDPDGVLVRYEQTADSIEAILARNKASQAEGLNKKENMWHAASIPVGVMFEWKKRYNVDAWAAAYDEDQQKAVVKLLNDPEWRYLRVKNFII